MDWKVLDKKLRRISLLKEVFALSPDAFLVGGYLRDIATGLRRPLDVDFVLKGRVQVVAQELARRHKGTVVVLGDEGLTRVVLGGKKTIDLSKYAGTIEDNLSSRDFTVNSIAWSPGTGIVDSCNGIKDIKQGIIRTFSKLNLNDDPLRIFRAYRFRAQFGWKLERQTREFIKNNSKLLKSIAPERITLELFKLLEGKYHVLALRDSQKDGVLEQIISINNSQLCNNIKLIARLYGLTSCINIKNIIENGYQGLGRIEIMKLSLLLLGSKTGECRLKLSNKLSRRIEIVSNLHIKFKSLSTHDLENMFLYFEDAGDAVEDLLALSGKSSLIPELRRYQRIQRHPLAGAYDIMEALGIQEGRQVGRALRDVKKNMFVRELKSKGQIIKYLKSNIAKYK